MGRLSFRSLGVAVDFHDRCRLGFNPAIASSPSRGPRVFDDDASLQENIVDLVMDGRGQAWTQGPAGRCVGRGRQELELASSGWWVLVSRSFTQLRSFQLIWLTEDEDKRIICEREHGIVKHIMILPGCVMKIVSLPQI